VSDFEKLGPFLQKVANWHWNEFVEAEHSDDYTSNESIIFALIRACVMERMDAIRLSLHRLDGKLVTPIKIEYPKIYFLFPNAVALDKSEVNRELLPAPEVETGEIIVSESEAEPHDIEKMSLRETLALMGSYPRSFPRAVVKLALETEQWMNGQGKQPDEIPRVKTVVAAHLLVMAQSRDIGALTEVFDQLQGKLVETLQVLGDDIKITNYSAIAPPGAERNKDGVYQIEAKAAQDSWAAKLKRDN
jgi:hypothetical protein